MRLRRPLLPLALLALSSLPALAAPPRPSLLRPDILYTAKGEFLQVSPMRPLTLNAHVEQFAYDPLGLEAAIVGSETQGDQTTHFVKTIAVRSGHEISRLAVTGPAGDSRGGFLLLGWSVSGKYVLLHRFLPDPQDPNAAVSDFLRWDMSVTPPALRPIDTEAPLPPGVQAVPGGGIALPSPTRRWIVFKQYFSLPDTEGKPGPTQSVALLYDPERDTFKTLALPPKVQVGRWVDDSHLRLQGNDRRQLDVVTGQVSPLTEAPDTYVPAASKRYPDLTLDVEARSLTDKVKTGGRVESSIVWVRRTPTGKAALGAAAAGLTPGKDDPQSVWSPTGRQVAFLAHGDLCVADLQLVTGDLAREKLAVGLRLTLAEQERLAQENAKQIGLGITQYTQDDDEKLPASDGFADKIDPYLPANDVFSADGHPFVYTPPSDLGLAAMASPAETPLGYVDFPGFQVVLYGDGHVKHIPKQQAGL